MASSKNQPPQPAPLPKVGGSYLLDVATGEWILQELGAANSEPTDAETNGTDP